MHLAEEEIDEHGERPQDQIVQPPNEGRDVRLFLPHDASRAQMRVSQAP